MRSLRLLFANGRWLTGFSVGIGGWVLYVVALRAAPLSLVQAVAAGGVGVLAFLASRFGGVRLARRELAGVALALTGLAALAATLAGPVPATGKGSLTAVLAWIAGSLVLGAVAVLAGRRAAAFGAAAGLLYAAGDVATKAAVAGGGRLVLVVLMLACHGLAFVLLQLGFQRGGVLVTAGLASLLTNAAPILAGTTLFGEALPGGWLGAVRGAAFAAVIAGGAGLAATTEQRTTGEKATTVPVPVRDAPTGAW